jgi:hypothetical protein
MSKITKAKRLGAWLRCLINCIVSTGPEFNPQHKRGDRERERERERENEKHSWGFFFFFFYSTGM